MISYIRFPSDILTGLPKNIRTWTTGPYALIVRCTCASWNDTIEIVVIDGRTRTLTLRHCINTFLFSMEFMPTLWQHWHLTATVQMEQINYLFIFIHWILWSFNCWFINLVHSCICPFIHFVAHTFFLFIHLLIHAFAQSFIYSVIHLLIGAFLSAFLYSFLPLFIRCI